MMGPASEVSSRAGASDAEERFAFELSGTREADLAARRALLARNDALPGAVRDDVLLLMTELATNAVRHADAGPPGWCASSCGSGGAVRVAVWDEGPGFARKSHARGRTRPAAGAWCSSIGSPIAGR
jgi:anti-sigma regulatory factor (Ser/Thr protein kinase)